MGYLDRENCNCNNGKKPLYINPERVAEQQRKAQNKELGTYLGISLFSLTLGTAAELLKSDKIFSNNSADDSVSETRTVTEIKDDIEKILTDIGVNSVSEAETLLEHKKITLDSAKANENSLKQEAETRRANLNNAKTRNNIIPSELTELEKLKDIEEDRILKEGQYTSDILEEYERQIEELKAEQKRNKEVIAKENEVVALEEKYNEIKKIVDEYPNEIIKLETTVNNLHKLEKQLKKSKEEEAKTTLANYQHESSENITDILDKLKNAKNNEQKAKYETKLKEALQEYINSGYTTNNTLNNLANLYGIQKK